jgi:hypothetical protein
LSLKRDDVGTLVNPGSIGGITGATTLIVSLGIISKPSELVIIEVAVFLLVAQALAINRLAGLPYPLWDAPVQIDESKPLSAA